MRQLIDGLKVRFEGLLYLRWEQLEVDALVRDFGTQTICAAGGTHQPDRQITGKLLQNLAWNLFRVAHIEGFACLIATALLACNFIDTAVDGLKIQALARFWMAALHIPVREVISS